MGQVAYFSNDKLLPAIYPEDARELSVQLQANTTYSKGQCLALVTAAAASAVQTITKSGSPTGGSIGQIVLQKGDQVVTTALLAYDVSAAAMQSAIDAVYGSGKITVSYNSNVWTLTWGGDCANQPQPLVSMTNTNLTGGSGPAVAVATGTAGVANGKFAPYDNAGSGGKEVFKSIVLPWACKTDETGQIVVANTTVGGPHGERYRSTSAYFRGIFKTQELAGLDTAALSDPGCRLLSGTVSSGLIALY